MNTKKNDNSNQSLIARTNETKTISTVVLIYIIIYFEFVCIFSDFWQFAQTHTDCRRRLHLILHMYIVCVQNRIQYYWIEWVCDLMTIHAWNNHSITIIISVTARANGLVNSECWWSYEWRMKSSFINNFSGNSHVVYIGTNDRSYECEFCERAKKPVMYLCVKPNWTNMCSECASLSEEK